MRKSGGVKPPRLSATGLKKQTSSRFEAMGRVSEKIGRGRISDGTAPQGTSFSLASRATTNATVAIEKQTQTCDVQEQPHSATLTTQNVSSSEGVEQGVAESSMPARDSDPDGKADRIEASPGRPMDGNAFTVCAAFSPSARVCDTLLSVPANGQ